MLRECWWQLLCIAGALHALTLVVMSVIVMTRRAFDAVSISLRVVAQVVRLALSLASVVTWEHLLRAERQLSARPSSRASLRRSPSARVRRPSV